MDNDQILERFSFYQNAPNSLKEEIIRSATVMRVPAGHLFYNQGVQLQQLFLLSSGRIRVFRINESGRIITLYRLHEGETCLINMLFAFVNKEAPSSAMAETNVEVVTIPFIKVRSWVHSHEAMREFFFKVMAARIHDILTLVEMLAFQKIDERLADFLLQYFCSNNWKSDVIAMTHEEIAAELGSAREVISRTLNDFERYGAIKKTRGRIRLLKKEILKARVGNGK